MNASDSDTDAARSSAPHGQTAAAKPTTTATITTYMGHARNVWVR